MEEGKSIKRKEKLTNYYDILCIGLNINQDKLKI